MLEVVRDYFGLNSEHMFAEIHTMRRAVEHALDQKKITYDKLKSALVPAQDRREIALIFDTLGITQTWYGYEIMEQVIPLFAKRSNHSVLVGDYLNRPGQEDELYTAFAEAVVPRRIIEFQHPTQFYIVYINNLTDTMVERFDDGLIPYPHYVGIAEMTYGSTFKTYLSTMLVNSFVKFGNIVLQGHEPDRADEEDVNMNGYPFEKSGYICRSISDDLMGVMLSYKIERPIFPGFEVDTEMALNAISKNPINIEEFEVEVA